MPDLKIIQEFSEKVAQQKSLFAKDRSQSLVSLLSILNHLSGNAYDERAYQGFLFKRQQGELLKLLLEGYLRLCQSAPLLPKPLETKLPVIEKKESLPLKAPIIEQEKPKIFPLQIVDNDKENVDPNPGSPLKKKPLGLSLQTTSPQKVIKNFSIADSLISNFDEDDSFVIDEPQDTPEMLSFRNEKTELVSFLFDQLSQKDLMSQKDFKTILKANINNTSFSLQEEAYKVYKVLFEAQNPKPIVKEEVKKKTAESFMDQIMSKAKEYINFVKKDGSAIDDNSIAIVVQGFLKPNCTADVETLKFRDTQTPLTHILRKLGDEMKDILEQQSDPKAKVALPHLEATIKMFLDQLERIRVESLTIEALTYTVDIKRDEKKPTESKPLQMGDSGIPLLPPNLVQKGGMPLPPPNLMNLNKPKTTMVEIAQLNLNSVPVLKKKKDRGYLLLIDKNFFADEYLKLCQKNDIKDMDTEEKKTLYKYFALGDKEIDYFTNLFEPFLQHISHTLDGLSIFSKHHEKDMIHLKSLLKRMDILSFCDHIRMTLLTFVQNQRIQDTIKYQINQEKMLQIDEKAIALFQDKIDNVFLLKDFKVDPKLQKDALLRQVKNLLSLAQVELQDKK